MTILEIRCGKVYISFRNADSLLEDIAFTIGFLDFIKKVILKE